MSPGKVYMAMGRPIHVQLYSCTAYNYMHLTSLIFCNLYLLTTVHLSHKFCWWFCNTCIAAAAADVPHLPSPCSCMRIEPEDPCIRPVILTLTNSSSMSPSLCAQFTCNSTQSVSILIHEVINSMFFQCTSFLVLKFLNSVLSHTKVHLWCINLRNKIVGFNKLSMVFHTCKFLMLKN